MPIDSYTLCPGGTGKKVKFCCPDLAADLTKIERMIEGDQHLACLSLIDRLLEDHPDRACLLAAKVLLLRMAGHAEQSVVTAAEFVGKHPENPLALAESTMATAATLGGKLAMESLSRAIEAAGKEVSGRLYEAMGVVAQMLAVEGQILAARAVFLMQAVLHKEDERPREMLVQIGRTPNIPLLVKDDSPLASCSEDAPWKDDFQEALSLANVGQWAQAAERLEKLADDAGNEPSLWRNLATLRGWLADTPGSIEALRKYASLDVPLEDAVEAEAVGLLLSEDPLGDRTEMFNLIYSIDDVDAIEAVLTEAPQAGQVRTDMASLVSDDGPPPRAVFFLFDRPMAESGEPTSLESVPRVLCQAVLFGRQTDKPARLEVMGVVARDMDLVKDLLKGLPGDQLQSPAQQEVIDHISATQEMLTRNWRMPESSSRQSFGDLINGYVEDTLLETWPGLSLGVLDGKSPGEAAGDDAYRVKVLAAIMVVEFWLEQASTNFDCNRLRSRLGLPELGSIDPDQTPVGRLPLVRLNRVITDKLSDDALVTSYQRAMAFSAREALQRFALAIIARPSLAERQEQHHAYALLARLAENSDDALKYIDQGRRAAEAAGQSSASWDLLELSCRFERAEGEEVSRLINHLQSDHFKEPGVPEALTDLLMQTGLIRPDGTPAIPAGSATAEQPGIVTPGEATGQSGKLWTPDSQKPADEKPGIWTPGSD